MKKVLFLRNVNANWAQTDLEIVKREYKVEDFYLRGIKSLPKGLWSVLRNDMIFAWFGSHSFLPFFLLAKTLGKKVFVVTAGFDVAKVPVGEYGAFCEGTVSRRLRDLLYKCTYRVLSCSKSNYFEGYFNARLSTEKLALVELGFSRPEHAKELKPWSQRKNQVVVISSMGTDGFYRKGVFRSLQLAELMPDVEFLMAGGIEPGLKKFIEQNYAKNIRLTGHVDFYSKAYSDMLNQSKILLQLSFHEGFGASVLDAAVYGCLPVVSGEYSLPEVVGDKGKVLGLENYEFMASEIRKMMSSDQDVNAIASYYLQRYPIEKRAQKILAQLRS